jgi:LEA14-like dessication related protein
MKKVLLIGGVALAGFGLYRYFRYQVDLALNYDYNLKDFKIISVDNENVKVEATFALTNRSNFQVEVKAYDIDLFFKDKQFANTASDTSIMIQPNSTFEVVGQGSINIAETKTALLPFLKDVAERKPIDIQVSGEVKVVFLGIPTTLKFDKESFTYSTDLLREYNLDKPFEKFKAKYPKLFGLFGLK